MTITTDSNLVRHAHAELTRAGLLDKNSDYDGMLGQAALQIVQTFAEQGHSGASAAMVIDITQRLMRFEPLTPLTNDPAEWIDHTGISNGEPVFQSTRNSEAFSTDGGKTYYLLSEREQGMDITHTSDAAK